MRNLKSVWIPTAGLGVAILLVFLWWYINQMKGTERFDQDFSLAVIETTEQSNQSILTFYDHDLVKVGTQKINLGGMGSSFDLPRVYRQKMYVIPKGLGNQKDLTVVLEYDLATGSYQTYDMKQPGMNSFAVNERAIYTANTLNNASIINRYDKSSGSLKTISKEGIYSGRIDLYDDTLYVFAMSKDNAGVKSYLYRIDTPSFTITDILDISSSGTGQNDSLQIGDDLYFTNQNELSGQGSDHLSKFNRKDKTLVNIQLTEKYPFQILPYKDQLIISHYDLVQLQGNKITIYDPKTGAQQVVALENSLAQIFIQGDQLYARDGEYLYVYGIVGTAFKLIKKVDIYTQRENRTFFYLSGFFMK